VRSKKSADINPGEAGMAKGEQRSNRETKKPKKDKIKTIAAAPSQNGHSWRPLGNRINSGFTMFAYLFSNRRFEKGPQVYGVPRKSAAS
jgi:hypothetical protein